MARYEFWDEWRIAAPAAQVWEVTRRVEEWPTWWPIIRSVTRTSPGDAKGVGATFAFVNTTRLPYDMTFEARVVRIDEPRELEAVVVGRLEGRGRWQVRPEGPGALMRLDWSVTPHPWWMRLLSPIARPLFIWNHASMMKSGGPALARHLGTTQFAPPAGGPSPELAALRIAATLTAVLLPVAAMWRRVGRAPVS